MDVTGGAEDQNWQMKSMSRKAPQAGDKRSLLSHDHKHLHVLLSYMWEISGCGPEIPHRNVHFLRHGGSASI
jgi:hypothetical protein